MPQYEVELSDGRVVTLEADRPPGEAEVLAALGESDGGSGADILSRPPPFTSMFPSSPSSATGIPLEWTSAEGEPETAIGAIKEGYGQQIIPWSPTAMKTGDPGGILPTAGSPATAPEAAFYNTFIKGSYDFLNTGLGVTTLGLGAAPSWLQRLVGLGFSAEMTGAAAEMAGEASVTGDPQTMFEAAFTAAPVPFMARPTVRFGENTALTRGDVLEIGGRELLKEVNEATLAEVPAPSPTRRIGVSPAELGREATDALASPEAQSAVELEYSQKRPGNIRLPWDMEGMDAVRALRNEVSLVEPTRTAERVPGGGEAPYGKVSYMREAEAPTSTRTQEAIARETPRQEPPPEPSGTPVETPPVKPKGGPDVTEGIDFANIQRPHRVGVERGLELTEADVPALEQQRKAAYDAALEAGMNNPEAFKSAFGKGVYLEGVLEGAKRKGPNYEFYLQEQSGRAPEGVPTKSVGTTEPSPATDFVSALERWKFPEESLNPQGQLFTLPHPDAIKAIGKTAWNNAIDVAIVGIKAGRAAKEAIEAAVAYLKKTVQGFDEAKIRENLSKLLELEGPRVEGTEQQMRKSAARATTSEQVPPVVQEKIATAPESFYKRQREPDVKDVVAAMSDAELAAVPETSNIYIASRLQLSTRLFEAGKLTEGYEVFKAASKTGTDWGQNINQFKFLKGQNPLNVVHLVNQGLKEAGRDPLTKPQAEKLGKTAKESIDANKSLDAAKDAWLKEPTDANATKADAAKKASDEADLKTQREMASYKVKTWPQMLKAFAQGNPLTPMSQQANIVGNSVIAPLEAASRSVGAALDVVRAAVTRRERKLAVSPVRGTVEAAKGFMRGAAKAPAILARGSGDVVKGETRAQLQPLRSFIKAFAKNPEGPTVGGKTPLQERVRMAVEGVFGVSPEAMLRMLAAADKPPYEAARARLINEQAKLTKLPSNKLSMAQKFPELFFDRETLQRIADESSAAVFQRKSKTVSYLESLIKDKGGDWADLAFTLLVAPYRLTPWNLVGRTLSYFPPVALFRTLYDAGKGNTRSAEINAGRMVVGGTIYLAGYYLYKNGLVGPSLDDRSESQKSRLLSGEVLPPNHVNIDGLIRLMNDGDPAYRPGDDTWDLTRGGGAAGAIITTVANVGRDFERKPEDSQEWISTLLKNGALEQASFTVNQSFLKGVTGILDAVRDRNLGPYVNSVENMLLSVGTPNTLTAISRATREYAPDLSAEKLSDEFENVVRNRFGFAGLDDYLPLKRDLWGRPMPQTPQGRNAILYHLFDISKNKQVTDDPVALELYDLWRTTSDGRAIPSIPKRQITSGNDNILLAPEQYSRLAELVGQHRRLIAEQLVTNPNWQDLDSENKLKVLDTVYDKGLEIGKALWLSETPPKDLRIKPEKAGFRPAK